MHQLMMDDLSIDFIFTQQHSIDDQFEIISILKKHISRDFFIQLYRYINKYSQREEKEVDVMQYIEGER